MLVDDRTVAAVVLVEGNAVDRPALGRKNWTFAGSDEGGRRAAAIYTLIATAKLNDVDPQTWLADVLARLQRRCGAARRLAAAARSPDRGANDVAARLQQDDDRAKGA
jgi:hypothetical protein